MTSKNVHPMLKSGMVLWVGEDARSTPEVRKFYYLTYDEYKESRGICFEESIPSLKKLGIEVTPHWKASLAAQGFYGAYGVNWNILSATDYMAGRIQISPVVQRLYEEGMSNKAFLNLLNKE